MNASPSLSATTGSDLVLKTGVINDVLSIVFPDDFPEVLSLSRNRLTAIAHSFDRWSIV